MTLKKGTKIRLIYDQPKHKTNPVTVGLNREYGFNKWVELHGLTAIIKYGITTGIYKVHLEENEEITWNISVSSFKVIEDTKKLVNPRCGERYILDLHHLQTTIIRKDGKFSHWIKFGIVIYGQLHGSIARILQVNKDVQTCKIYLEEHGPETETTISYIYLSKKLGQCCKVSVGICKVCKAESDYAKIKRGLFKIPGTTNLWEKKKK
jgi:hypothetical protein